MAFSHYMFHKPNANDFRLFSTEHIVALAIIAILAILLVAFRKQIQAMPKAKRRAAEIGAAVLLLLARGGLYLYYFTFQFDMKEILPVYLCRIVIIALLYTLITGQKKFLFVVYYFGIFFGVVPLIVVDTGGHTFPHATYFSFFIGHGMILLANLYYIMIEEYRPRRGELRKALFTLGFYFVLVAILNPLVGGNYNYLEEAPSALPLGDFSGTLPYKVTLIIVFFMIMFIEYLPFSKIKVKEEEELSIRH
ncbi:MAG: TIGR02206 family membrane protein [Eubacteriales bacterium]|nr:TIGR02206 family membrane protein [Eubacteriales bacterium]